MLYSGAPLCDTYIASLNSSHAHSELQFSVVRNAVLGENYITDGSVAFLGGYQRSYSTCREILTLLLRTELLPNKIVCYY